MNIDLSNPMVFIATSFMVISILVALFFSTEEIHLYGRVPIYFWLPFSAIVAALSGFFYGLFLAIKTLI